MAPSPSRTRKLLERVLQRGLRAHHRLLGLRRLQLGAEDVELADQADLQPRLRGLQQALAAPQALPRHREQLALLHHLVERAASPRPPPAGGSARSARSWRLARRAGCCAGRRSVALGPKPRSSGWVSVRRRSEVRGSGTASSVDERQRAAAVTEPPVQGSRWLDVEAQRVLVLADWP